MLAEKSAAINECVVTYKELTADERAKMEAEAREDYYRCQKDLELYATEKGMKRGMEQGIQQMLVSAVDHAMQNLSLTLEQACEALGVTMEDYQTAKNRQETVR